MAFFAFKRKNSLLFELWRKMNSGYFVVMREAVLVFFASLYEAWAVLGGVTGNNLSLTCSNGVQWNTTFWAGNARTESQPEIIEGRWI